jgi:aminobenzoyl-glutamate transport protein
MSQPIAAPKSAMQKFLDVVEKIGNKVPHPAVIFLMLIAIVVVLSQILHMLGTGISYEFINPETHKLETAPTIPTITTSR